MFADALQADGAEPAEAKKGRQGQLFED